MLSSSGNFEKGQFVVYLVTWIVGNVKHVVVPCLVRLDMSTTSSHMQVLKLISFTRVCLLGLRVSHICLPWNKVCKSSPGLKIKHMVEHKDSIGWMLRRLSSVKMQQSSCLSVFLSVCMHVCMYVCMYACMYICMYVCTRSADMYIFAIWKLNSGAQRSILRLNFCISESDLQQ